jgi:excisionase family DNA binding protein
VPDDHQVLPFIVRPAVSEMVHAALLISMNATSIAKRGGAMEALLIKIPEVAARLGVSRAKVYELIAYGTLPAVKLDGCRRVRTCDIEAFVDGLSTAR